MAISQYNIDSAKRREAAYKDYAQDNEFEILCQKAGAMGYRKASLSEINASAERRVGYQNLFCWAGGLWVKN